MSSLRLSVWGPVLVLGSTAWAQVTQRVSVGASGQQGDDYSARPVVSADGRFVVFTSHATNLAGDSTGFDDVFLRDRLLGTTELISVDSNEVPGDQGGNATAISPDGRYVVFSSSSTNLVPGDTNFHNDVFLRDRLQGTTERVSNDEGGSQRFDGHSVGGAISADGRYAAFNYESSGGHLFGNTDFEDIYVWDRQNNTAELASVPQGQGSTDGDSVRASFSADGRYLAFESKATNLVSGDDNGKSDIFVRDLQTDTTECVSLVLFGFPSDGDSGHPSISADGRYVAFVSGATNLVSGDTNGHTDVFVHDRQTGTTERISVSSGGVQGDADIHLPWVSQSIAISPDGRFVAFESLSTNLVPADTNGVCDIFLRDRQLGTTQRVSLSSGGVQGNALSYRPSISADGNLVSFSSDATNLVPGDTNGVSDIFVHDRTGGPSFTSLCSPGAGGVVACPCANPPSGSGRGCDNSAATGGAALTATGGTYLSSDSLVFTTSGEKPTALSTVWQGTGTPAAGILFGQGVRCANGALKRLYNKSAVGGSITAPNFGAGDATVSARSAAKGDLILAGQVRYYFVSYRDPIVLGGCPATSTFNATQTARVSWAP